MSNLPAFGRFADRLASTRLGTGWLLTIVAFVLLAAVTAASAFASPEVVSLGGTVSHLETQTPECPAECHLLEPMVGFVTRIPGQTNPAVVPFAGRLVNFTVKTGEVSEQQITAFEHTWGTASLQLEVLAPTGTPHTETLVARGPIEYIHRHPSAAWTFLPEYVEFGETKTYPIPPIAVLPGEIVALAVPSWLPAVIAGTEEGYDSSQPVCSGEEPAPWAPPVGSTLLTNCEHTSSVAYTATLVPESMGALPPLSIRYEVGSVRSGRYRRRVLKALTVSGTQLGEHVLFECGSDCFRFGRGPVRRRAGRGYVTFSNLNVLPGAGGSLYNWPQVRVRAKINGALGREAILLVEPGVHVRLEYEACTLGSQTEEAYAGC
jgi:hypothetical protein